MISNLVIMNMRGDILIYRDYKNDIRRGEVINFTSHLLSAKGLNQDPIIYFKVPLPPLSIIKPLNGRSLLLLFSFPYLSTAPSQLVPQKKGNFSTAKTNFLKHWVT